MTEQSQPAQTGNKTAQPSATPTPASAASANPKTNPTGANPAQGTFSAGEGDASSPDIAVEEVDFTGAAFTPDVTNIKVGDWVFFKNKSAADLSLAGDYPGFTTKTVATGKEYKAQFTQAGSFSFYDGQNQQITAKVVVAAK